MKKCRCMQIQTKNLAQIRTCPHIWTREGVGAWWQQHLAKNNILSIVRTFAKTKSRNNEARPSVCIWPYLDKGRCRSLLVLGATVWAAYASIANKTLQTGSNVLVCCIFQCTMKDLKWDKKSSEPCVYVCRFVKNLFGSSRIFCVASLSENRLWVTQTASRYSSVLQSALGWGRWGCSEHSYQVAPDWDTGSRLI